MEEEEEEDKMEGRGEMREERWKRRSRGEQ